jgi:hypothetical protein
MWVMESRNSHALSNRVIPIRDRQEGAVRMSAALLLWRDKNSNAVMDAGNSVRWAI